MYLNFIHFWNGIDVITHFYMHASILSAFFSCTWIFRQFENNTCISVLHEIRYAVMSHPFLKWDKVCRLLSSMPSSCW